MQKIVIQTHVKVKPWQMLLMYLSIFQLVLTMTSSSNALDIRTSNASELLWEWHWRVVEVTWVKRGRTVRTEEAVCAKALWQEGADMGGSVKRLTTRSKDDKGGRMLGHRPCTTLEATARTLTLGMDLCFEKITGWRVDTEQGGAWVKGDELDSLGWIIMVRRREKNAI